MEANEYPNSSKRNPFLLVQEEAQDIEDDDEAPSMADDAVVARHLWKWGRSSFTGARLVSLMEELCRGRKAVGQRMLAVAQKCSECQMENLRRILRYVAAMKGAGAIRPILFCERVSYDESPLRLRVCAQGSEQAETELAKIFVVETSWSMLLQKLQPGEERFLVLQGYASPTVRAADGTSGEACV